MKREKPDFDAVYIMLSFIIGRDDANLITQGFFGNSNSLSMCSAFGIEHPYKVVPNDSNSLDDCASVHVLALDSKIEGYRGYIVSSNGADGMKWESVNEIVARRFPEAVKDGLLSNDKTIGSFISRCDTSETKQAFGFQHAAFGDAMVPVVKHYLELLDRESGKDWRH